MRQLVRYLSAQEPQARPGLLEDGQVHPLRGRLSDILHDARPSEALRAQIDPTRAARPLEDVRLLPPIDEQEVWGSGVTYLRSKQARQEESADGGDFYDKVYEADRPELFFKALPHRVTGHEQAIRIRRDTRWCVPEPELALVLAPDLRLVGYTIGNDQSARDIEGENPLYLPQAKTFDECCGLGPAITLAEDMPPRDQIAIGLRIERSQSVVVEAQTRLDQMKRSLDELIDWLGREASFPFGVVLLTGTGIVPPDEFSLEPGDRIAITIDGIGTLQQICLRGS